MLEQPKGSLLEYYPTWRELMRSLYDIAGSHAVPSLNYLMRTSLLAQDPRGIGTRHPKRSLKLYNVSTSIREPPEQCA